MKLITPRQFHGVALFLAVLAYATISYKLISTGWYINVTDTTRIFTGAILGVVGMVLWNLVAHYFNFKKASKK